MESGPNWRRFFRIERVIRVAMRWRRRGGGTACGRWRVKIKGKRGAAPEVICLRISNNPNAGDKMPAALGAEGWKVEFVVNNNAGLWPGSVNAVEMGPCGNSSAVSPFNIRAYHICRCDSPSS